MEYMLYKQTCFMTTIYFEMRQVMFILGFIIKHSVENATKTLFTFRRGLIFASILYKVEQDTIRTRVKEVSDLSNDLELQIAEIKGENAASATQTASEQKAKEEILEAKV